MSADFYAVSDVERLKDLCGPGHLHLAELEARLRTFHLRADSQGGGVRLNGEVEGLKLARAALQRFEKRLNEGAPPVPEEMTRAVRAAFEDAAPQVSLTGLRKPISGETAGQRHYLEALRDANAGLVFGLGPAGTGKTFLAVAAGISEVMTRARDKLIITRPAVEAGEKLGFLPGDLAEKVDPYLLPIWDALRELVGAQELDALKARGAVEVAPLAFMRGRTLKDAFVIVDEAQNATRAQMKMVLTRLGRRSRMVVTGDPSQVDLPRHMPSGLSHAVDLIEGLEGVRVMRLSGEDVVRHDLVGRIVARYDAADRAARGDGDDRDHDDRYRAEPQGEPDGASLAGVFRAITMPAETDDFGADTFDEDDFEDSEEDDFADEEAAEADEADDETVRSPARYARASTPNEDADDATELVVEIAIEDDRWLDALPQIEEFAQRALLAAADVSEAGEVSLLFADDTRLRALNKRWRGKDKSTNVLSWPADETAWPFLGDIALSFDTAAAEAKAHGKTLEGHVTHLLIHGYLHLLGYDHEGEAADAEEMETLEINALESLGFSDPYENYDIQDED